MGGRAGPYPLPGQRRDLGPAQACAGGPAAPCWRAGGRGIRPYRDVLAAACGEKAGGVSGAGVGWPTTAHPLSTPTVPPQTQAWSHQREGVVGLCQLLGAVLLQHHHALEPRAAAPGTGFAVHQIRVSAAVLTRHEQYVEHLHLEQGAGAVIRR